MPAAIRTETPPGIKITAAGSRLGSGWPASQWRWEALDARTGDLLACGLASEPSRGASALIPLVVHERASRRLRVATARVPEAHGLRVMGLLFALPSGATSHPDRRVLAIADPGDLRQIRARVDGRWIELPCVECGAAHLPIPLAVLVPPYPGSASTTEDASAHASQTPTQ